MNCIFFGDYPEDINFCLECPIIDKCAAAQNLRYPLECWRIVAVTGNRELWVERVQVKKR